MTLLPVALAVLAASEPAGGEDVVVRGRLVEGRRCQSDPTQTYTLYLPLAYPGARSWPLLLVMDPRGRSVRAAERFVPAAEEYGFIVVSSNDTRSDGDPEPNIRALRALWPEIHARFAVDPRRVYLAGFSGTGTLALDLARRSGQIAGVIVSGARWEEGHARERLGFPCFATTGDADFNHAAMVSLHDRLRKWGSPKRLEVFEGEHAWMPAALAREALGWMELQAMKSSLRPRDATLVRRLLDEDLARAAELESAGRPLSARRRFEAVVATFEGLAPVEGARHEAERLGRDPATRRALDSERRWDRYEDGMLRRHREVYLELLTAELPIPVGLFVARLGLDEIHEHARAPGDEGSAGRRVRNALAVQTGFYLPRDLRQRGDYLRAAMALDIATRARPDRAWLWYDLARARARSGLRGEALDALEEAVARGFDDRAQLAADEDLVSLRSEERFRALIAAPSPEAHEEQGAPSESPRVAP